MANFFGKVASGAAYAIGLSIGFGFWSLLKRFFRFSIFGGGAVMALQQLGVDVGRFGAVGKFINDAQIFLMRFLG